MIDTSTTGRLLPPGAVLADTYEIVREIGRGGMGAVYLATHRRLPGKCFAVKLLLCPGDEAYARFRREAEIAGRLGHPNIVEVVDWNTLPDGSPYLVMEFLQGQSLEERLQRGPLTPEAASAILRQIGSALAAAHAAGVVHRDLKPANVFLCPADSGGVLTDRVKVLDFGISKMRDSTAVQTQDLQLLGTPRYMAPEQALGENSSIDARTDLFALGAIAYEMLSGRAAFEADSIAKTIYQVVNVEPEPLATRVPGLPPAMTAAVTRALAKPPDQRFPDVDSFVEAFTGQRLVTLAPQLPGEFDPSTAATEKTFVRPGEAPGSSAPVPPAAVPVPAPLPRPEVSFAAQPGSLRILLAAAVVLGALAVGYGVVASRPQALPAGPDAALAGADAAQPGPDAAAAAGPDASQPGEDAGPPDAARARPLVRETVPPEVAQQLDEVQASLDRQDFQPAVRLAERTQQARPTTRGRSLLALAYCGIGRPDRAMDVLRRQPLPPSETRKVCQFCQSRGSSLVCPP